LVTFQKRSSNFSFKWTSDVGLSIVLIMAVLCLWVLFSPFGIG
jgi:SSS family solute:Na+ symporter